MSKKTETKKEDRIKELEGAVKDCEKVKVAVKRKWSKDRIEMNNGRKDSLQEHLTERSVAIKSLRQVAEIKRKAPGEVFDKARTAAAEKFDSLVKTATEEFDFDVETFTLTRDEELQAAKREKKAAHDEINQALHDRSAPIIAKHKMANREIEDDFIKEMKNIDEAEEQDLDKLKGKLVAVEAELSDLRAETDAEAA